MDQRSGGEMNLVDIKCYVLQRIWDLRDLPEFDFKCRVEELIHAYLTLEKKS
jgi:hypothetical protein